MNPLASLERNTVNRAQLMKDRDDLIVDARLAHYPVAQIALASGLSRMQVNRIVTDAWVLAEVGTGQVFSWWRSEEAVKIAHAGDPLKYYRKVTMDGDGQGWQ